MNQEDLAAASGWSRPHIAHLERNTYRGGRNAWEGVAGALGKSLDYFLGGRVVSEASAEPQPNFTKDRNEVALLNLWRKLSPRGKRAFAETLLMDEWTEDGGTIRLSREGDDIILVQEFSPPRQAGGQL